MSTRSKIEWTEATWNPVRGCTKVSSGCKNCYAETFAERFRGVKGHPYEQGFDLRLVPEKLEEPLHWKTPRRIFVNSMSDLFQTGVSDEFIAEVFAVMALSPQHTFQILTKRPARMLAWFNWTEGDIDVEDLVGGALHDHYGITASGDPACGEGFFYFGWPIPNVWLGVSVENQHFADERIPLLLQTPAAVRFISAEPLLGPVNLVALDYRTHIRKELRKFMEWEGNKNAEADALKEVPQGDLEQGNPAMNALKGEFFDGWDSGKTDNKIDWVICGGESGPGARPMQIEWAQSLRDQCKAANVAFFMKQLGGVRDKRGKLEDLPEDLRIREYPQVPA